LIEVKYEFTTVESSIAFQSDLRRKELVDYFDVDVVWSDVHSRTDSFGNIRGMGMVQRLKLWRDRYTSYYSLTVFTNRSGRHYREYDLHCFDNELRSRDDRHRQLRINVRGGARRGSADTNQSSSSRRFSISQRIRPRQRSVGHSSHSTSAESSSFSSLDIRYLGFQFTRREGGSFFHFLASSPSFSLFWCPPPQCGEMWKAYCMMHGMEVDLRTPLPHSPFFVYFY
jgi:hypothetical protein